MTVRTTLLFCTTALTACGFSHSALGGEIDSADRPCWNWLVTSARDIDFDQLEPHRANYIMITIAKSCHQLGENKLAMDYLQRAIDRAEKAKRGSYHFSLYQAAIDIDRLDIAEKIVKESKTDTLLDRWDLERFRRGEEDATENFPRAKMTFYNAMELANAYIDLGKYDEAEEFVMNVKISEENDPEDVAGIAFEMIAKKYMKEGDVENAKRYIDKAMDVAGRQFYTGYAIEVNHRAIHGRLTEDLEMFARKGAAYRGHMGRELVQRLVYELLRAGHFDEAAATVPLLEDKKDRDNAMRQMAVEQATRGDIQTALETVEKLGDPHARNAARLGIAEVVAKTGKEKTAKNLADFVMRGMPEEMDEVQERTYQDIAQLYGVLRSQTELEQLVARAKTPLLKASCISRAIVGFASKGD